ncbi:hypothetical protein IBE48_09800 [Francisella philomiragia]|uniref:Uncharacterized protein n=1 Tax=Francisella philomiragia TaxID=28110 RepID=A0AAW3DBZ8_9GAMM|nr:hypothetical protein [Francisella philomiragia]KFJ43601.1 hypothetical protein DR78_1938 [Francisella philomiragia]MBK2255740.1 hypothetical protein [Francisella philomiragia]MBK2274055.1 hypothetical protein [Francisella philomiragia]MBK2277901.1 hypothetical protein [Francisella philomiragia]MBK2281841.1 hypothetical protein [Francisella philomiragia]
MNNNQDKTITIGKHENISFQVVQNIYNEITGKKESISKRFDNNYKISFNDIKQLNKKMLDISEQFNISNQNCNITIYHTNDQKEIYSSFERFSIRDMSSTNPVESIELEYNFMILLPKTNTPKSYNIKINLRSRAALIQKEKNSDDMIPDIFFFISDITASYKIEYIDYVVAKNFQHTIDEWLNSIDQSTTPKINKFISSHYSSIPFHAHILTIILLSIIFLIIVPKLMLLKESLPLLLQLAIICFTSIYVISNIVGKLTLNMTLNLRNLKPLSYIKLNKGDEDVIDKTVKLNSKSKIKVIISLIGVILINIVSSLIILTLQHWMTIL